ncbi:hypothetical protein AB0937_29640 [Streptomyces sp. NPDC047880]|uniref:hypothetical protein n=1 Tax=Streptomyces sp. NPDC047880 TaxID=3155626 RepID=UPI003454D299
MFYRPAEGSWRTAAQSPHRSPVLYALGEMTQTLRARGDEVTVALWGPRDGAWHRFDIPFEPAAQPAPVGQATPSPPHGDPAGGPGEPTRLADRMTDRRHQVLMAGLTKAGFYDLSPEDDTTVRAVVERLDEAAVRQVAHWLGAAGGAR